MMRFGLGLSRRAGSGNPYAGYLAAFDMSQPGAYTEDTGRVSVLHNLSPAGAVYDLGQDTEAERPTVTISGLQTAIRAAWTEAAAFTGEIGA